MSKTSLQKLLTLLEMKTQLEKTQYAEITNQQRALIQESEELRNQAVNLNLTADADAPASQLLLASNYTNQRLEQSKTKKTDANSLTALLESTSASLKKALKDEHALTHILEQFYLEEKKNREKCEERAQENVLALKRIR